MATTYNNLYLDARQKLKSAGIWRPSWKPGRSSALQREKIGTIFTGT